MLLCFVIAIADGDTLTARCETDAGPQNVIVRLAEIDAPEKRQAFGSRSRQILAALCFNKSAEVKPQTRDRYGRTVARITCDGTDANAAQIRAGMAWAYTAYLRDASLARLEAQARAGRRGLWGDRWAEPPWEWRQRKRRSSDREVFSPL